MVIVWNKVFWLSLFAQDVDPELNYMGALRKVDLNSSKGMI